MADGNGGAARWQDELYDLLRRHNVTQFAYVPDAGHRILIDRSLADPGAQSVALTTEEEGVALLAGADLGGARGVLLMQSSGTGNCINMLSLIKGGHFPFLTLVSMRGDFGEGNPWQYRWARRSSRYCRRWASSACASSTRKRRCRRSAPP
jgi:sulfopyruvate decarboxylase TPP-binding subunit